MILCSLRCRLSAACGVRPQARELAMVLWATAAVGGPSQDLLAAAGREVRCMEWRDERGDSEDADLLV
jgi:hypothetical protein